MFAWGLNNYGQLGVGDCESRHSPTLIEALLDQHPDQHNGTSQCAATLSETVQVAAGEHHSMVCLRDGSVWTFGRGDSGQLGTGTDENTGAPPLFACTPSLVPGLCARAIGCGCNHSFAIGADDGHLYTWGFGDGAQLANAIEVTAIPQTQSLEERVRAFYELHNPEKAHNAANVALKYAGRETELFAKLKAVYGIDSDEEDDSTGATSDELQPHCVQQRGVHGQDVGRVLQVDGGGQHTVVLVELQQRQNSQ